MFKRILQAGRGLAILLCAMYFGVLWQQEQMVESAKIPENKEVSTIAIVNLDNGVQRDKEFINYGASLLEESEGYVITTLQEAKSGIDANTYAAYIIIPEDFSQAVESLNKTPRKAQLKYTLNEELTTFSKSNAIINLTNFEKSLDYKVGYMYLTSIIDEFHHGQSLAEQVMRNDQSNEDAISKITVNEDFKLGDYTTLVDMRETEALDNNALLDIPIITSLRLIDEELQFLEDTITTDYTNTQTNTTTLIEAIDESQKQLQDVDILKDKEGQRAYKLTGITAFFDSIDSDTSVFGVYLENIIQNTITKTEAELLRSWECTCEESESIPIPVPPVIEGNAQTTLRLGEDFNPLADVYAYDPTIDADNSEGTTPSPIVNIEVIGEVDTNVIGTTRLIYRVYSEYGLEKTWDRIVIVLDETQAPEELPKTQLASNQKPGSPVLYDAEDNNDNEECVIPTLTDEQRNILITEIISGEAVKDTSLLKNSFLEDEGLIMRDIINPIVTNQQELVAKNRIDTEGVFLPVQETSFSSIRQKIVESNQEYQEVMTAVGSAMQEYQMSNQTKQKEKIDTLQKYLEGVSQLVFDNKKKTDTNWDGSVDQIKETILTSKSKNQDLLEEFTKKLWYTKQGNKQNQEVKRHILEPTDLETKERLEANSQQIIFSLRDKKELATVIGFASVVIALTVGFIIYNKRKQKE